MGKGKKRFGSAYYPADYKAWKEEFQKQVKDVSFTFFTDRVHVVASFVSTKPKTTILSSPKGDIDNHLKSLLDALTDMGVWGDDKIVESVTARKRFANALIGETSHIEIEIYGDT